MDGFNMGFDHWHLCVQSHIETVHGTKVAMLLEMQKSDEVRQYFKNLQSTSQ